MWLHRHQGNSQSFNLLCTYFLPGMVPWVQHHLILCYNLVRQYHHYRWQLKKLEEESWLTWLMHSSRKGRRDSWAWAFIFSHPIVLSKASLDHKVRDQTQQYLGQVTDLHKVKSPFSRQRSLSSGGTWGWEGDKLVCPGRVRVEWGSV